MIKLIASDLDGSLLDENNKIPSEFYELFRRLQKKVAFVAASGRSYVTLHKNFEPVSDSII